MQNAKLNRYMSSPVESIQASASLVEAEERLRRAAVSALAVVDERGRLEGVVSRTDVLRVGAFEPEQSLRLPERAVREVMTSPAMAVSPEEDLAAAAKRMRREHVHRLFVEQAGDLVGVLSTRDVVKAVRDAKIRTPLAEIASEGVVRAKIDDPIILVLERLEKCRKHGVVIVDGDWPVGVVTQLDALWARRFYPTAPAEQAMSLGVLVLPPDLPAFRAAAQALALGVRRILVRDDRAMKIVTTFDFTRLFD